MASLKKALDAILGARSDQNVRFDDLRRVLLSLGFEERIKGGHHIFWREGVVEIINVQSRGDGKAKAYQVRQVRQIVTRYQLR